MTTAGLTRTLGVFSLALLALVPLNGRPGAAASETRPGINLRTPALGDGLQHRERTIGWRPLMNAAGAPAATGSHAGAIAMPSDGPAIPRFQLVVRDVTTAAAFADATCPNFTIDYTVAATGTIVSDMDAAGKLLREVRHTTFTGTLYNHKTGTSVPYHGKFVSVEDMQSKTFTLTGLMRAVNAADGTALARESGVQVQDDASGAVLFEKGTFDLTHHRVQALCAALR
jgi:hypothetical protein